jgi:hypothetical protein
MSEWTKRLLEMLMGVGMAESRSEPRALFLFLDMEPKPDTEICSGQFPSHLGGKPCPYSEHGRMPAGNISSGEFLKPKVTVDQLPGSIRACKLQKLGRVDQWQEDVPLVFPEELAQEIVYKCRQTFIVVLLE